MKPKSSTLFHFTKNPLSLRGILADGFLPRMCQEDARWIGVTNEYIAYPMVCFCDIPLSRIAEHTNFYGSYGIGMTKEWGLRNKLAPVIYAPPNSAATKAVEYLLSVSLKNENDEAELEDLHQAIYRTLSFIKPLQGNMLIGGSPIEKDFYQESEWRHVPDLRRMVDQKNFSEMRDQANEELRKETVQFSPADVKYIFLANEHEIPEMVDFINTKLGHFPHNDVKLLTTRIVSLESVANDI